ncbi:MAG: hypothetical protein ABSG50_01955 [Opitutaceae bacterium]|jgi:hypothetical protein
MPAPLTIPTALPRRVRLFLEIGWAVIIAKCLAVPWMIAHWQIPIHPGWVIVPTLIFAALVTFLVLAHWKD